MKISKAFIPVILVSALVMVACGTLALPFSQSSSPAANTAVTVNSPQPVADNNTSKPITGAITTSPALSDFETSLEGIYQAVNPSVVSISVIEGAANTTNNNQRVPALPFGFGNNQGSQPVQQALGSGFVWDTNGNIVTNNHVISGASTIDVTFFDGTTVPAKLVGADPNADLAVVKVSVAADKLHPVIPADSSQVKVGQIVIAIGNPFGLANTMTEGIVSAVARSLPVGLDSQTAQTGPTYNIPDIIQTDAAINPGNSGGVLLDDAGRLVGVTAAIESSANSNSGIGFVIPSNIVQKVVPALISSGSYQHPYLGISGTTLTPELASAMGLPTDQQGALIVDVTAGGPAAKGGLQASTKQVVISGQQTTVGGDVIIAINGQSIKQFEDLASYLFNNTKVGDTVTVTVLRNGKQQDMKVTLGALPTSGQ
jgi:serine protease Do